MLRPNPHQALGPDAWGWRVNARCRDEDPSIFFHPDGERGKARLHRRQRAKQICEQCPVRVECREHSLTHHEAYGVWGGLTEEERNALLPPV
ncbi:WhiB family transcriptional regulator [Mycolicibacterium sp. YH-1]|nr:WhiB family transcriptional regulator [Mycolicibacterium sp. YH-1]